MPGQGVQWISEGQGRSFNVASMVLAREFWDSPGQLFAKRMCPEPWNGQRNIATQHPGRCSWHPLAWAICLSG